MRSIPKRRIILNKVKKDRIRGSVSTVSVGDINNDGKYEIISGGEPSKDKTTITIKNEKFETLQNINLGTEITTTACIDIDNDEQDEILLGSNNGRLFIYKFNKKDQKVKRVKPGKIEWWKISKDEIRSIKGLQTKKFPRKLIIIGTRDGILGVYYFNRNRVLECVSELDLNKYRISSIWSTLPIILENVPMVIVGGDNSIALLHIYSMLGKSQLKGSIIWLKNPGEKIERIYDIALLKEYPNYSRIICATYSGNPLFFDIRRNEINIPKSFKSRIKDWVGSSSYAITLCDIDGKGDDEIIIGGKTGNETGYVAIYKFDDKECWNILHTDYSNEIYSIVPFQKSEKKFILLSMRDHPLYILEPISSKRIERSVRNLGRDISRRGEYAFFVGAGFSHPIFKLADDAKDHIMKEMEIEEKDLKEFLQESDKVKEFSFEKERLPLEFLFYYIKNQINLDSMKEVILKYYGKKGETENIPLGLKTLGDLMKKNIINIVFSVNYDTLLETYLEGSDFQRVITQL